MYKLTLKRVAKKDTGVFGVLLDNDGMPFAVSAELPDKGNKTSVSCIPHGVYECSKRYSNSRKYTCIAVNGVRGRTYILMHRGNIPLKDSEGCILVGEKFENIAGQDAIQESRKGFDELMRITPDKFMLHIYEV